MATSLLSIFLCLTVLSLCCYATQDQTRQDGARGKDVVVAVVDLIRDNCIFAEDRLFLQRLAQVESDYGVQSKTYRSGYYGGIWQVDRVKFQSTIPCPSSVRAVCYQIETSLKIDWDRVTWHDLLKPLYSGLAASLYIQIRRGTSIPGDVTAQATIWKSIYSPTEPISTFISKAHIDDVCSKELDLAFIVDTSGSIGSYNFVRIQEFLVNVVKGLKVGGDDVRIATVSFSSLPTVDFGLRTYHNEAGVIRGINSIIYDGGSTGTAEAIQMVISDVFTQYHGMRTNSVKVAMLVTDGGSNYMMRTVAEAKRAKDHGIVFFSVGVGDINEVELRAVVTEPVCTHMFLLPNFTEIQTVLHEIRRSACRAQVKLNVGPGKPEVNISINIPKTNTNTTNITELQKNVTKTISINTGNNTNNPNNNSTNTTTITVLTTVNCGVVHIYASYETTHPGPAYHDLTDTATDKTPSYITVNKSVDGRPLYITYMGSQLPKNMHGIDDCNTTITSTITDGPPKGHEVLCKQDGVEHECTKLDFITSPYKKFMCTDTSLNVENPCNPFALRKHHLFFPHPFDNAKFIRCDYHGDMYITECPPGKLYNVGTGTCGTQHFMTSYGQKLFLEPTVANPCTVENIIEGKHFFEYPLDKTKFIQCDPWGIGYVMSCRPGDIWFQNVQTCSRLVTHSYVTTTSSTYHNPCTKEAYLSGRHLFPHPYDPHKYINCGTPGNYWIQSCPVHMVFDGSSISCIREIFHGPVIG